MGGLVTSQLLLGQQEYERARNRMTGGGQQGPLPEDPYYNGGASRASVVSRKLSFKEELQEEIDKWLKYVI